MKRREFLKTLPGSPPARPLARLTLWSTDAQAQWTNQAGEGRQAARAALEAASCRATSDQYMANVKKFTEKTGIEVRVDNEGWEDVRPKAAVAANTGAGPDIILSTNDDANLYPEKLLDVTDLPSTWARNTAADIPCAIPICGRTARSGSACRSARPA